MAIKHRGVKIVPVKITRYEVRTVDNRKLKTFSSTSSAKAWIDGYLQAVTELTPKSTRREAEANGAAEPKQRRARKAVAEQPAA